MTGRALRMGIAGVIFCVCAVAEVREVEVQTRGTGPNLAAAVNSALVEAISQVNGTSIDSAKAISSIEISVDSQNDTSYLGSQVYASQVSARTKGQVRRYSITDEREADGLWEVTVMATIATFVTQQAANRKRIAVLPLRTRTESYRIANSLISGSVVANELNQAITNHLVQARKFTVLDREYMAEVTKEKGLVVGGDVRAEEFARLGQMLVADYLLVGEVEEFSYVVTERKSRLSDRKFRDGRGAGRVAFRLVDTALGQIVMSETVSVVLDQESILKIASSLSTESISLALASSLGADASVKLLDQIYPITMVAVSGSEVVLGQGGDSIRTGAVYEVFKYQEKMFDPYTNEYLGRQEAYCCDVRITRVLPKQAYGEITDPSINLEDGFAPKTYVLRGLAKKKRESQPIKVKQKPAVTEEPAPRSSDW